MVDDLQMLYRTVAVHTEQISQIRETTGEVKGTLTRIETKLDTSISTMRWTPGAKATVMAAIIGTIGMLLALVISQGGPLG